MRYSNLIERILKKYLMKAKKNTHCHYLQVCQKSDQPTSALRFFSYEAIPPDQTQGCNRFFILFYYYGWYNRIVLSSIVLSFLNRESIDSTVVESTLPRAKNCPISRNNPKSKAKHNYYLLFSY